VSGGENPMWSPVSVEVGSSSRAAALQALHGVTFAPDGSITMTAGAVKRLGLAATAHTVSAHRTTASTATEEGQLHRKQTAGKMERSTVKKVVSGARAVEVGDKSRPGAGSRPGTPHLEAAPTSRKCCMCLCRPRRQLGSHGGKKRGPDEGKGGDDTSSTGSGLLSGIVFASDGSLSFSPEAARRLGLRDPNKSTPVSETAPSVMPKPRKEVPEMGNRLKEEFEARQRAWQTRQTESRQALFKGRRMSVGPERKTFAPSRARRSQTSGMRKLRAVVALTGTGAKDRTLSGTATAGTHAAGRLTGPARMGTQPKAGLGRPARRRRVRAPAGAAATRHAGSGKGRRRNRQASLHAGGTVELREMRGK